MSDITLHCESGTFPGRAESAMIKGVKIHESTADLLVFSMEVPSAEVLRALETATAVVDYPNQISSLIRSVTVWPLSNRTVYELHLAPIVEDVQYF